MREQNGNFVIAADSIAGPQPRAAIEVEINGTDVDSEGHWQVQLNVAQASDADRFGFNIELRCWVLFYEAAPPKALTGDELAVEAERATRPLTNWRRTVSTSGWPEPTCGRPAFELGLLERRLLAADYPDQALQAAQLIVQALRSYVPPAADDLDYLLAFAEARHNLIFRLSDAGRDADAIALADETIAGYRGYAALAGADILRLDTDLIQLAKRLDALGQQQRGTAGPSAGGGRPARLRPQPGPPGRLRHRVCRGPPRPHRGLARRRQP